MKKRIAVEVLRPGMVVCGLERAGTDAGAFREFRVQTLDEIERLKRACRFVYIDTAQTADPAASAPVPHASTAVGDFAVLAPPARDTPLYPEETTLEEELARAQPLFAGALHFVEGLFEIVRRGQAIPLQLTNSVVSELTESTLRNPDALLACAQRKSMAGYTHEHSLRCAVLALVLGRYLEFTAADLHTLALGGLFADLGKSRIDGTLLSKAVALTAQEKMHCQMHTAEGARLVASPEDFSDRVREIVERHHERFDGAGYPARLQSEAIGLFASLASVVDTYDALTSDRPYASALSPPEALRAIFEQRGRAFHPDLVDRLLECLGTYPVGSVVEMNSGMVAVVVAQNRTRRLRPKISPVMTPNKKIYQTVKILDLAKQPDLEIRRALARDAWPINPTNYLPTAAQSEIPAPV
jgi:HD-GYP domain-containing protein (c-di-GMP phosphodiesterase class II)